MSQLYLLARMNTHLSPDPWAQWPVHELPPGQRWRGVSLHSLQRSRSQLEAVLAQTSGLILWAELAVNDWHLTFYSEGQAIWQDGDPDVLAAMLELPTPAIKVAWQRQGLTPVAHLAEVLTVLGWETAFSTVTATVMPPAVAPACACAAVAATELVVVPFTGQWLMPLADVKLFFRLAWMLSDQAHPLLLLPGLQALKWPAGATSHLHANTDGQQIGLDQTGMPFPLFAWLEEALALLAPQLEPGQQVILQVADAGESPDPGASQRWEWEVLSGHLCLRASFPAVTEPVLSLALALSRWVDVGGVWECASTEALAQFIQQARQRDELWLDELETTATTLSHAQDWQRAFIARDLWLDTFDDAFDRVQARALRQQLSDDAPLIPVLGWQRPTQGVLWDGVSGRFLAGLPDQLPHSEQQALRIYTADFAALGFAFLCDLVWEPGSDVFMRVFVNPEALAYGAILLGVTQQICEFETVFPHDMHLTSTQLPAQSDREEPPQRVYSHPDLNLAELWQAHQEHVAFEELCTQFTPVAVTPEQGVFLEAFDRRLVRQFPGDRP